MHFAAVTVGFISLFLSPHLNAQMSGVEFVGDPLMSTSDGRVTGCGINFTGVHVDDISFATEGLTGSVNIYAAGMSGIKAGLFDIRVSRVDPSQLAGRAPSVFKFVWVRADGIDAVRARRPEHIQRSDDEGFLIIAVTLSEGLALIEKMLTGARLWVGFKSDAGKERIFSGPVKMTGSARDQISLCFEELMAEMKGRLSRRE